MRAGQLFQVERKVEAALARTLLAMAAIAVRSQRRVCSFSHCGVGCSDRRSFRLWSLTFQKLLVGSAQLVERDCDDLAVGPFQDDLAIANKDQLRVRQDVARNVLPLASRE